MWFIEADQLETEPQAKNSKLGLIFIKIHSVLAVFLLILFSVFCHFR